MTKPDARFERFVDKSGECWAWTGTKSGHYGQFWLDGKMRSAHRVAWELQNGPLDESLVIDHKCRNRLCVNPAHLSACTQKQNLEHQPARTYSKSGLRGVIWDSAKGKYRVSVGHHGKRYYFGYFDNAEQASEVAVAARNSLYTNNLLDLEAS